MQGLAVVNMTNPEALNQSNMVIEKVEKLERDKAQVRLVLSLARLSAVCSSSLRDQGPWRRTSKAVKSLQK